MKTPKGKEVFVFDNEGKTADRFTIIVNDKEGNVFGASEQPFHPLGFGQFCGDMHSMGYGNRHVRGYVREARESPKWLGKEVTKFNKLPEDVQKYVEQISE